MTEEKKFFPTLYSAEWDALWAGKPEPKSGTPEFHDKWFGDFARQRPPGGWTEEELDYWMERMDGRG